MKRLSLFILCLFLLCGCQPEGEAPQPSSQQMEEGKPEYGGVLSLYSYRPDTYNPLFTQNETNLHMLRIIYEPLIAVDRNGNLSPMLAESWRVSADGLQYDLSLRQGVTFHDGSAFTAADAAATLRALKNAEYPSPYSETAAFIESVSGEGYSLSVRLKEPHTGFLRLLTVPMMKAEQAGVYEIADPLGTGAFSYSKTENKKIYLTRNDLWWNGLPYLESVEIKLLPDQRTALFSFQAMEIDAVPVACDEFGQAAVGSNVKTAESLNTHLYYLGLNTQHPLLRDAALRRLLAASVDKERIVQEVLLSHGEAADTFVPKEHWLYPEGLSVPLYEPKEVYSALSEEPYQEMDLSLKLLVNDESTTKTAAAQMLASQMTEAGFSVTVESVPFDIFYQKLAQGEYDLYLGEVSVLADVNVKRLVPVLIDWLMQQDTEIAAAVTGAAGVTEEAAPSVYRHLQQVLTEKAVYIPLCFDAEAVLYYDRLGGVQPPSGMGRYHDIGKWYMKKGE